ncbi:MAG TPA: bifunctional serine/threonine-protein kinase/ABC transporter substrate-binding protein [Dehalococcoidia bacterium]|nr:bifunctional serine/threonine-protein kinase/ABC transporter substrate-binding protein [Dehalococcoidia bacterium]
MSDSATPQVISHYQVDSLLGVGAMGSVYLGVDRRDGTLVAIKLIAQFLASDQEFRKRFEREAHVAALLRSPYTVRVLDYGVEEGRVFMAMEYVDGPTVREILESGPLEPARATRITLQVARALEEAEARGIVHRDVKPDNILLGPEDTAKLADFGVARQDTSMLTQTGGFYGTASYAAPEQFGGKADNRSDIYALGASLYHMLLGRSPVQGDLEQARRRILAGDIAFADLSPWPPLRSIVERAMQTDPVERYQSARQMAGALEGAFAELGRAAPTSVATVVGATGTEGDWRTEEETLRLALKGPTTSLPFGKRYASLKYELAVTNQGQEQARVQLRAADRANACRFSLPDSVSVPPGATSHVSFSVRPRKRRLRGPNLTRIFTIAGSSGGGGGDDGDGGGGGGGRSGGPPATTSGRFDDASYGWLPLGMSSLALVIAVAALLVATLASGTSSSSGSTNLRIGLLVPFSGLRYEGGPSWEGTGSAYLNAARIAVSEINADGGVLGQPVVLVHGDAGPDSNVGIEEARRLIEQERVQAIIGDVRAASALDIANKVANPNGVVQITPTFITDEEQLDLQAQPLETDPLFLFKTEVKPEAEGVALAQLVKEGNYGIVCSVFADNEDAVKTNERLKESASGVQIIEVHHSSEVQGSTPEEMAAFFDQTAVAEIEQCAGADAIVLSVYPDVSPLPGQVLVTSYLLKAALERGLGPIFVWSYLASEVSLGPEESGYVFDEIGWDRVASVKGTRTGQAEESQGDKFDETYWVQFGEPPTELTDPARFPADLRSVYDAVYLLALAAEKAESTEPDAIRNALPEVANAPGTVVRPGPIGRDSSQGGGFKKAVELIGGGEDIDYEGAAGPIEFNADRDNVRGAIDIWSVDASAQQLVTDRVAIVDLATGEADVTDIAQLREYFEALETLDRGVNGRITSLSETYTGAFTGGDVEQTNALYEEYVSIFQEFLDRAPGLGPPAAVKQLADDTMAANERLNALNRDRLARLKDASTPAELDAILGPDPEYNQAVEGTVAKCHDLERFAAAYGIEFEEALAITVLTMARSSSRNDA